MIEIDLRKIKSVTFITMSLPVILFLFGWVKLPIALPLALLAALSVFFIIRGYYAENRLIAAGDKFEMSRGGLFFLVFAAMLWCFLAGQGGFFHQTADHHFRNAIFRDLINLPWPVEYEQSNAALVYYLTYWLVPAGLAKIPLLFFGADMAWLIGNFFLYCWSTLLVVLVFLLLIAKVKTFSFSGIAVAVLIFIFFSGLDIVGFLSIDQGDANDLEWWAYFYQYSANTTQLFWVFNQSTPTWVLMLLLLNEKETKNYAFLCFLLFAYAPIPFIGALPFLLAYTAANAVRRFREKQAGVFRRRLFSLQNILAVALLFPVFALFYATNGTINSSPNQEIMAINIGQEYGPRFYAGLLYVMFCVLEFGIYAGIIFKNNKKNLSYWVCVLTLCIVGLFRLSEQVDFAMRASIPALLVLTVLVIEFINQTVIAPERVPVKTHRSASTRISAVVLIVALFLGSLTPFTEIIRAFTAVAEDKKISATDDIKTFSDKNLDDLPPVYLNFLSRNYYESDFARYLGKTGR